VSALAAIVTAAGRSARLGPLAEAVPKGFLPVDVAPGGGLEFPIGRLVDALAAAGADPIALVGTGHPWFARYAKRDGRVVALAADPRGEWHAVAAGAGAVRRASADGAPRVIVASSDNVFEDGVIERFAEDVRAAPAALLGVHEVASSEGLCVVRASDDGERVVELVEKPPGAPPGLAKAGLYGFAPVAFAAVVRRPPPLDRFGEASMTEAVRTLVAAGVPVAPYRIPGGFVDVGTAEGLAAAIRARAGAAGVTGRTP
jgi:dTDP-glucose pyrophosphorylase